MSAPTKTVMNPDLQLLVYDRASYTLLDVFDIQAYTVGDAGFDKDNTPLVVMGPHFKTVEDRSRLLELCSERNFWEMRTRYKPVLVRIMDWRQDKVHFYSDCGTLEIAQGRGTDNGVAMLRCTMGEDEQSEAI